MRITADIYFAIIPEWVLYADISPSAIRLYCTLARYANDEGKSNPSRRTLADKMHCSTKTIDRAVAELVAIGALRVYHNTSREGDYTSNDYHLHQVPWGGDKNVPTWRHERRDGGDMDVHQTKAS